MYPFGREKLEKRVSDYQFKYCSERVNQNCIKRKKVKQIEVKIKILKLYEESK